MREIVVISGKGGTGKTTVCAAFAHLSTNKIICDLDVDAPDLHILLRPEVQESHPFISGNEAVIRGNKVVVSSPEVKHPVAVRYAWSDNPSDANLCNKDGLLASPFRTDNW